MGEIAVIAQQHVRLERYPDWQSRLGGFLARHEATAFHYGSFDCCLFVCDAIEVMTGTDVAAPFRGVYSSRRQAWRALETYGSASVQEIAARICSENGMPEINVRRAQRGDVLLCDRWSGSTRDLYCLALVGLQGQYLTAGSVGYQSIPAQAAVRAWHV